MLIDIQIQLQILLFGQILTQKRLTLIKTHQTP